MIINKIGIENFGKLSGYRVDLDDGLNTFLRDNGSGKTTLTYFIKAMLYGLEQTTRQSIFENERKRFAPWGGGSFGGFMCFTVNERSYRVERRFGSKLTDDSFALYDLATGMKSLDYTERLGEELFGIDADGFERTVFISEKLLGGENKNPTVAAKLSDLSGVEGDLGNFDNAINAIEKEIKVYKKKGGSGILRDTEKLIREAEKEIEEIGKNAKIAEQGEKDISELTRLRDDLATRKTELEKAREAAANAEKSAIHKKRYAEMTEALNAKKEEARRLSLFFEKKLPTGEETYFAQDSLSRYERDIAIAEGEDDPALSEIVRFIGNDDGCDAARECVEARKQIRNIDDKLATLSASRDDGCDAKSTRTPILAIAAAVLFAASAVAAIFFLPAIAVSAVAVLLFAIYLHGEKKKRCVKRLEEKQRLAEIGALREKRKALTEKAVGLTERFTFGKAYSFDEKLDEIEKKLSSYPLAKEALTTAARKREKLKEEALSAKRRADEFLALFPTVTSRPFDEIRAKRAEYDALVRSVEILASEAEDYAKRNAVFEPDGAVIDKNEINESIAELDTRLIECERAIARRRSEVKICEESIARRDEIQDKRDEYEMKLDTMQSKYDLLVKTKDILTRAKDAMNARYVGPTRAGFERYMTMLDGECNDISVNASFAVTKNDAGMTRIQDCYSRGTRDAMTLALRLALCDTLYGDEQPPLILDDPYSSFDDRRVSEAMEILKKLSSTRQILYFTCSSSRALDCKSSVGK